MGQRDSLKIMLVVTSLGVGGAERLVTALADRCVTAGHEVIVVRLHGVAEIRPCNPRVTVLNLGMRRTPFGVMLAMWRLDRLIRKFQPDVVNSHLVHANLITRILRVAAPIPRLISSVHNIHEGGSLRVLAYRLTDRLTTISTNVSHEAVQAFEKRGAVKSHRMVAVYNGIDVEKFRFSSAERLKIRNELDLTENTALLLAVGRLCKQKDYPSLLEAMSLMSAGCHWRLVIVGVGPEGESLVRLAKQLGVAHQVTWLGVRHDVSALMSACDVFVLPSAWEGFGLVVAEAMACERPVVATDCGGVREVLGECGSLVPTRDPEALATAILKMTASRGSRKKALGQAARQRVVERYSIGAMADRYLAIYSGAK